MKNLLVAFFLIILTCTVKGQNVVINDTNFVNWLQINIPTAMNGNQMDTTSLAITTRTNVSLTYNSISDLSGIRYFDALKILDCQGNQISSLPALPNSLIDLHCTSNKLTNLPALPNSLKYLSCSSNSLTSLPILPNSLINLLCANNQLTSLPSLPSSLYLINANYNQLTNLPVLPSGLSELTFSNNLITNLPLALPSTLKILNCGRNQITNLPPILPNSLLELKCGFNQLSNIPTLPTSLKVLSCEYNYSLTLPLLPNSLNELWCGGLQLNNLPTTLPSSLKVLYCHDNQLSSLPVLPNTLATLNCAGNYLTSLPTLPPSLNGLYCQNNQLLNLPILPITVTYLDCRLNQLSTLPTLPPNLFSFYCNNNNINCFPVFPTSIADDVLFDISNNPFSCLPNYIQAMNAGELSYPICVSGNIGGCPTSNGIFGFVYKDSITNCLKDPSELSLKNIPIKLYDSFGNSLNQTSTAINGVYSFSQTVGSYTIIADTVDLPFTTQCLYPGIDSTVTLSTIATNVNFALECKNGFDIGVQSVVASGMVFPGQLHRLNIRAGDISHWYNLNCAAGVSGQVQISIAGNVTYAGIPPGALTPTVNGNVYTYDVIDFGLLDNSLAFNLLLHTDTIAQADDTICVNVIVTPIIGDNFSGNNIYNYCYNVINSYDPNKKEVNPVNVNVGYQDWFTYTIHFQNTGNGPAINIRLVDTLSSSLNINTFQLINYSHVNTFKINGSILSFNFPDINLPDSTSDFIESQGFVQYRIKPYFGLPLGAQIKNTANIYFDFNSPIVTNTTYNNVTTTIADYINELKLQEIKLFPNPVKSDLTIIASEEIFNINFYNLFGELVLQIKPNSSSDKIDISKLISGIYFVEIKIKDRNIKHVIIKEN